MYRLLSVTFVAVILLAFPANAAVITLLTSPGQLNSPTVQDFESSINGPGYTFDATATLALACNWANCVTPSGVQGLGESVGYEPLRVDFSANQFQVGTWFGNDDFGLIFQVKLEVFDELANSLGYVVLTSNANDNADQFIGLGSDTAFRRAEISYQRPQAGQLSIYIDDFQFSSGVAQVPEPGTLALLAAGLSALALIRTRKH